METENGGSKSKMEDYDVIENIGRGAFGAASLVLHKSENKKYVLKKIRLSKHTEKFKIKACEEMNLIAKLRHSYILEYKDAWVEKGSYICIVTNYVEVGNIYDIMRKARRGSHFSEEKLCRWLTQLLLAIDYLHANRVLHRDLKLSNIFITKENDIRLGDYGLAKLLNEEGLASSVAGNPNYMCPELLADAPYCYKSDIWSLGCCMFEIAARQQAFRAHDMAGLINKINRCLISPLPLVYSFNLKQILKSMLRKSPEHRPTAAELLRHPYLQPYLLRCHIPKSTVFLPVTSPPQCNTKEKTVKPSPCCAGGCGKEPKDHGKTTETKLKQQRELLPLFEENNDTRYPNLLDEDDLSMDEHLETKRVVPTSCSGKISTDSEDSKNSGDNNHMANYCISMSKEHEEHPLRSGNADVEPVCGPYVAEEIFWDSDTAKIKEARAEVGDDKSRCELENPRLEKADALESLLELCADLLKQDKFDELNGVLKPFGDEAVSSRETAILLTKSLMNAQKKLSKES